MTIAASTDVLDEFLEAAQSVVGQLETIQGSGTTQFNEQATRDTIRHYAWGVSDLNPLWLDEEYARRSRFGTLVAPPTFPYSVVLPSMGTWQVPFSRTVPWTVVYGGTSWDFYQPILLDERVHATARLADARMKSSRTAGRMVVLTSEVKYWSARNELLARALAPQLRFLAAGADAEKTSELQGRSSNGAANENLPSPEALAEHVQRQGAQPLFWEDVQAGTALPDLPKGVLRMTDIIRWNAGTYGPPFLSTRVSATGELMGAGHYDSELAQSGGIPGAYDNGPLRGGWLSQIVTNWAGDWADMKHLEYSLRLFNVVGDVNTVRGSIVRKYREGDEGRVEVEVRVENQRGLASAQGKAVVAVPLRG